MHPAEPGGRLRLGSMESTAASRLPALLASYHKACPRVALEVSTGTSRALFDGVRARRLDCALVAAGPAGPANSMAAACAASRCSARNC